MDLISSSPNHVIREMTPKRNVIRECTEIEPVIRDLHPYSRPDYWPTGVQKNSYCQS